MGMITLIIAIGSVLIVGFLLWVLFFRKKPEPPDPPPQPPPDPEPPDPPDPPDPPPTPPSIPKLSESLTYLKSGKVVAPFLIPTLGINRLIQTNDYRNFLNRIVNNQWGNTLRIFAAGMWEPHWKDKLNFPYAKTPEGLFNPGKVSREWIDLLVGRVGEMVERSLFAIVAILDNCSLKDKKRTGFWNDHWLNGKNNTGKMSVWMPSVYHYYESEWHDPAYIRAQRKKRAIAGLDKDPTDAQIRAWIEKLDATGRQIQEDNYYLVEVLDREFGDRIGYEAVNEGMAGNGWHNIQLDLFNQFSIPKHRRFTSMAIDDRFNDFYNKPTIKSRFALSLHSIGNVVDYQNRKHIIPDGIPFIASSDGCVPPEHPEAWKELARRVLSDGNIGFESNLRPIFRLVDGKWKNVCGNEDWSLDHMEWAWVNAVREGWFQFLGQ
jgi:hypothetical protein